MRRRSSLVVIAVFIMGFIASALLFGAPDSTLAMPPDTGTPAIVPLLRDGNVWLLDSATNELTQLTDDRRAVYASARPMGGQVAVIRTYEQVIGQAGGSRLVLLNWENGEEDVLAAVRNQIGPLSWSPDGRWLATVQDGELVVYDVANGQSRVAASQAGMLSAALPAPAWSPSGTWLICPLVSDEGSDLWAIRMEDGYRQPLTQTGQYSGGAYTAITDDDFAYASDHDHQRMWLLDIRKGSSHLIWPDVNGLQSITASPDGHTVAFSLADGSLWLGDLTTGKKTAFGNLISGWPAVFHWLDGGARLLYYSECPYAEGGSGIYLLDIDTLDSLEIASQRNPNGGSRGIRWDQHNGSASLAGEVDAPFDWYRQQGGSGTCEATNCGPTSVAMSIQFGRNNQYVEISDIRQFLTGEACGGMTLSQLYPALDRDGWKVSHSTVTGVQGIRDAINRGHICIAGVNMARISYQSNSESRYGRYNSYTGGHILIVKGYSSDGNWLTVYDPNVWGGPGNSTYWYSDGTPKGKNRYYSAAEFQAAMNDNTSWAIEILDAPSSQPSVPPAPSGVSASDGIYTDRIRVTWNGVSGATRYDIYRSTSRDNVNQNQVRFNAITSTSYDDTSAAAGTTYYYWVTACNNAGCSNDVGQWGGPDEGRLKPQQTVPPAPSGVSASDGTYSDRVRVTWNGVSGATRYDVYRSTSGSDVNQNQVRFNAITSTSYDDTTAVAGTTYYYWVTACNDAGCSNDAGNWGGPDEGHVKPQQTVPPAPSGVSASDGTYTDKVRVIWNSVSDATRYDVYRSTSGSDVNQNQVRFNAITSTSYDDTTAAADTTYYYWVTACNEAGCSNNTGNWGGPDSGYRASGRPDKPTNLRISDTTRNSITLAWDDVSNEQGYKVYTWYGGAFVYLASVGANTTAYTDTDLPCDADQYYEVSAYNDAGESEHAGHVQGRTELCGDCNDVSFDGIILFSGSPCQGSEQRFSAAGAFVLTDLDDRVSSIYVGSGWSVRVYEHSPEHGYGSSRCIDHSMWNLALDYYESGNTGQIINDTISYVEVHHNTTCAGDCPAAPSSVSASDGTYTDKVRVTWNSVSGATRYDVYRSTSGSDVNQNQVRFNAITSTSYDDTSAVADTTYYYWVTACNEAGCSNDAGNWGGPDSGYRDSGRPDKPGNLRISGTTRNSITLAWDDVSNEQGYHVYMWNGYEFVYLASVGANTISSTHANLPCDTDQYYEVSAYNDAGESEHAGWIQGRTELCGDCNDVSFDGVILFVNSPCQGSEQRFSTAGAFVLTDLDDRVSSIYVGSGWSVRVYEHPPEHGYGSSRCIDHSMWDLALDYYESGNTGQIINDTISYVEVHHNTTCAGDQPAAPASLSASASSCSQINLSWQDRATDESDFHIERSLNGSSGWTEIATVGAGSTSYSNTGLGASTRYYYRVRAYRQSEGSYSAYSNVADATTPACQGDTASMGFQPVTTTANVGTSITVAVQLANVTNLGSFEFTIGYDPALLEVESITLGDFPGSTGRTMNPTGPTINNTSGTATFGAYSLGSSPAGASGIGEVALVRLQPKAAGTASLQLTAAQASDVSGQAISLTRQDGTVTITQCLGDFDGDGDIDIGDVQRIAYRWNSRCGDSLYEAMYDLDQDCDIDISDVQRVAYRWNTRCTDQHAMAVKPTQNQAVTLSLDPAQQSVRVGQVFTVDVDITQAQNLGAFEFTLGYDPQRLEVVAVSLGAFPTATGRQVTKIGPTIDAQQGEVSFGAYSLGSSPPGSSGGGTLAQISLRAKAIGQSSLNLLQGQVLDVAGNAAEVSLQHAQVLVQPNQGTNLILVPLVLKH